MSDHPTGNDPIDREAERARVQGSDVTADPLAHGSEGSLIGPTERATVDHKIRRSQDDPTEDIAAQRRDVVAFTHADHQPPGVSGMGDKGELERLGGNTGGEYDLLTDQERATLELTDERTAQKAAGASGRDDTAGGTTNSGDKAAPYNEP